MTTTLTTPPLRRMEPTNAGWCGIEARRALVGLRVPELDRVRAGVARLLEPGSPVGCYLDQATRRHRPLTAAEQAAWPAELVTAGPARVSGPDEVLPLLTTPLGHQPFRLVLGEDWVGLRAAHAVADGWSCLALLDHVLRADDDPVGRPDDRPTWCVVPPLRRDLLSATYLARRPGTLVRAWTGRRQLGGGEYVVSPHHVADPRHTTIYRRSPEDFLSRLRACRDRAWPGASVASMVLVGLRRSLAARLPEPVPGAEVVFDVRRAHTASRTAFGNWSAGVYVRPEDDLSPRSLTEAVARTRRHGFPVVAAVAARRRGRAAPGGPRLVLAPTGRPRLTLSHLHGRGAVAGLPWTDPDTAQVCVSNAPNGLETVFVGAQELGGRLHLSLSFYADTWEAAAVGAALDDLLADPALLDGPGRRRRW